VLHAERLVDQAPPPVYATLLDEGGYLGSVRTMYRLLAAAEAVRERRNPCRHPVSAKPALLATGPHQGWSWEITKRKGPEKWRYFSLYVILDICSRSVVGWLRAPSQSAALAKRLLAERGHQPALAPGQLTLHADRGSRMTSRTVAQLLADLEVTHSHRRPSLSNDHPSSEGQFKTLKYRPDFPERFGCLEHAPQHGQALFHGYNTEHRHAGIACLTPATVQHYGAAQAVLTARAQTLQAAFLAHPERFRGRLPQPLALPKALWINPPERASEQHPTPPAEDTELLQ